MAQVALIDAYQTFMQTARGYLDIRNEADYAGALLTLEELLEDAGDTVDDPLNSLIELLSQAIAAYESQDDELVAFLEEADSTPPDISLLRVLMEQHGLTGSDLPEIGDKTMVSKVLNRKRTLQRDAMEKLAERFGIRPAMFLGG